LPKQTGGIAEGPAAESGRAAGEEKAAFKKAITDNQQHKTFH